MLLLAGCTWRVHIESTPVPAQLDLPRDERAVTPTEVKLRYVPFGDQRITVTARGYRTIEANLRKDEIRSFRYIGTTVRGPRRFGEEGSRGSIRYLLVPEHGPVGTWTAGDVPQ